MKKIILTLIVALAAAFGASAQKFALVDMEYILRNVPSYEMANEQLNQVSLRWEKEVNELSKQAQTMYQNYQSDMVFLTDDQKKKREEEIYKKRQSLMKPIQEDVYNAVKAVAEEKGYQVIFDRASSQSIVFASPRIDVSNDVLAKLGYSK